MQRIGRMSGAACAAVWLASVGVAQSEVRFKTDVLPILQKSCMRCHQATYKDKNGRTRRPKGGLRLDGKGWMLKGGKHGAAVVPGNPRASLLLTRITLDVEDDDFMPRGGESLPDRQLQTIRAWIASGASFGTWAGAKGPDAAVIEKAQSAADVKALSTPLLRVYAELSKGLKPALTQAVQRVAGAKCQIESVVPQSPLLRVAFVSNEASVNDRDLRGLAPLAGHIAHLGLGKTKVTDRGMSEVGRMKRLARLDLNRTAVTDEGLAALAGLTELRVLNLHSTAVTDAGLKSLGQLRNLERVYLWNSKVTAGGVAGLQKLLPRTKISFTLTLPEPAPEREGNNRRRRKKD